MTADALAEFAVGTAVPVGSGLRSPGDPAVALRSPPLASCPPPESGLVAVESGGSTWSDAAS